MAKEIALKYGCNPNQAPARIYMEAGELPIEVLNGRPGYINFLDALNGWQLVKELAQATGLPAATSFKHVSPAGAAIGTPLNDTLARACFVDDLELSPIACAYAKARGADRMSSFGDFVSVSHTVDLSLAKLLSREVSDGIIAPGYDADALEVLRQKRKGGYTILKIDPSYAPGELERKEVFGITFEQRHNDGVIDGRLLENIVTKNKELPQSAKNDLILSLIALKYTQSNSVCYAKDGQTIGIGAGQQSRIHCTRLAGQKADFWYLRQHPAILNLKFRSDIKRPDRDNAIDQLLQDNAEEFFAQGWEAIFTEKPRILSAAEKREWLSGLKGVALGSDAFFPFGDNIQRAVQSGVSYIAEPGGSIRDDNVIEVCDQNDLVMAFTGLRLFHH